MFNTSLVNLKYVLKIQEIIRLRLNKHPR